MSRVCFGFEVHQPFRLDHQFDPEAGKRNKNLRELYFTSKNRDLLERVVQKCYIPATEIVLENLDQGFCCGFSLSGTLIEQMEAWGKDALDLFQQVASHRNAELLAQTYYHSLASLFSEKDEFEDQIRQHVSLIQDVLGVTPRIFENTEFIFNNAIASVVKRLGFAGVYAEGVERILGWRSPNYLYSCQGIKVLMRNYRLSDDIAFRFSNRQWEHYPLTADTFASWLAGTPGDCIHLFMDYETFGEHQWHESGIMEFLRWLPHEIVLKGNQCILPSQALEEDPRDELDIEETISWADQEKDTSAWLGNCRQSTAFRAVEKAGRLVRDRMVWRYLQASDHFHYMASKFGSCEEVHSYFRQEGPYESFADYMRVLSDFEERSAALARMKGAVLGLRCLPPEKAFHFFSDYGYTGHSAYSLDDFAEQLDVVPKDSIQFHIERGDFVSWIARVLGDRRLAETLKKCHEPHELSAAVDRRRKYLWNRLK